MGTIIACCGHELSDVWEGVKLEIDGTQGLYCKDCARELGRYAKPLTEPHVSVLKQWYPWASEAYISQMLEDLKLYGEKNHDFANDADAHSNFNITAEFLGHFPKLDLSDPVVVGMIWMFKQMQAAFNLKNGNREAKVETVSKRLQDISIYSNILRLIEEGK